jgi:hypothetical protein
VSALESLQLVRRLLVLRPLHGPLLMNQQGLFLPKVLQQAVQVQLGPWQRQKREV